MTPAKKLGDREIWSSSHFGTWGWQKQRKARGFRAVWSKRLGNTGMLAIPDPYRSSLQTQPRIWKSSFSKHWLSHVCHMSAGVSFCNSSAWGQMLSESKSGKQVGERMPGPWKIECSKVATQYKRPLARIQDTCLVDRGWTKLQKWKLWFGLKASCGPTRSYLAHQTNKLGALAGCCGGSTSVSTLSPYEWSNLGLVKLKGLESIQLDVVKVAGDAFWRGKNAQTANGKRPKIQAPSPQEWKSTGHPNCSPPFFLHLG